VFIYAPDHYLRRLLCLLSMIKTDGIFLGAWKATKVEAPKQRTTLEVIRNLIEKCVRDIVFITGFVVGAILGIVYFAFGCLAASNSDSDAVYKVCGSAVRDVLICDIIFSVVGICALIWLLAWQEQENKDLFMMKLVGNEYVPSYVVFRRVLPVFLIFVYFVLGIVSLVYSIIALTSPDCVVAMSSTDGGADSASGNMGSSLLAIMGVVYGSSFLMLAVIVMVLRVCTYCV
jgi:hypothetical protein